MMRMLDYIQRMSSLKRRVVEIVQHFFPRLSSEAAAAAATPLSSSSLDHQDYSYHRRRRLRNHTFLGMFRDSLRELMRLLDMISFVAREMRVVLDLFSARGRLISI